MPGELICARHHARHCILRISQTYPSSPARPVSFSSFVSLKYTVPTDVIGGRLWSQSPSSGMPNAGTLRVSHRKFNPCKSPYYFFCTHFKAFPISPWIFQIRMCKAIFSLSKIGSLASFLCAQPAMTSIYSCTWQMLKKILVVKFSLKVKVIPQSNTPFFSPAQRMKGDWQEEMFP